MLLLYVEDINIIVIESYYDSMIMIHHLVSHVFVIGISIPYKQQPARQQSQHIYGIHNIADSYVLLVVVLVLVK